MRFARNPYKGNKGGPRIIGIAGIGRGTGVTHTVLMLANYLQGAEGRQTAVLEWNDHKDFYRFGSICTGQGGDRSCYRIQDVNYYPQADGSRLAECLEAGYQQILIDFGAMGKMTYVELMRCSSVWLLMSFSEWQMEAFWEFVKSKESPKQRSWQYFTVFGSEESRKEWNKRRNPKIWRIPLSVDAFTVTRQFMEWAEPTLRTNSFSGDVSR